MAIEERAKSVVEVDGQQAKNELTELKDKAKAYRKELRDMVEKNDLQGVRDLEKKLADVNVEMSKAQKTAFDYSKTLKNLSGSSIKDLEKAQKTLTLEIKNTTRGTDEYVRKTKQLSLVRNEISKTRGEMNQFGTSQNKLLGLFAKGAGLVGGFYGAIRLGQSIINSAQATADKFDIAMGGINEGLKFVQKSIATMDFSNFFRNLNEAIRVGREYAETLDDIGDLNRALKIQDSESRRYILDRLILLKDRTRSEQERIKAADEIVAKENELARDREVVAKKGYDDYVKLLSSRSKLDRATIEDFVRNYAKTEQLRESAEKYNEALARRNKLELQVAQAGGKDTRTGAILQQDLDKIIATVDNVTPEIISMAEILNGVGKLTDEELDSMVRLFDEMNVASNSALEKLKETLTYRSRLLAREGKSNAGGPGTVTEEITTPFIFDDKATDYMQDVAEANQKIFEEVAFQTMSDVEVVADDISKMQLTHIRTNAEYELDLYYQTVQGKKALLAQQLKDMQISEREYRDGIKQLDDDSLNSRLDRIKQFLQASSTLFKEHTGAYRALASAAALIDTFQAANAAFKAMAGIPYVGPALGAAAAAVAIAAGLANVAKINDVQFAKGGYTGDGGTYEPAGIVHKGEYVIKKRQMQDPAIRGIVDTIIEPDRVSRVNYESASTAISNLRGYAGGGPVLPAQIPQVTINNDKSNQMLSILIDEIVQLKNGMFSGKIRASYNDREVEKISKRQNMISRIKSSVSRS